MMIKEVITKYLDLPGLSGRENKVREELEKDFLKYDIEIIKDNLGSIYALKKSKIKNALKVVVDSHMDEVGFSVVEITDEGLIKVEKVGGLWEMTLLTNRISIHTSEGKVIKGTILSPAPHDLTQDTLKKMPKISEIFIDIGATSKNNVFELGVKLGDSVIFSSTIEYIANDKVLAKAADNRIGVVACLMLLHELKDVDLPFDLFVGASTQEEVGLRGARTINAKVAPDFAIVVDVSPAKTKDENGLVGGGALIRIMDATSIVNPKIIDWQRKIAKTKKIKTQEFFSKGGTNAGIIHLLNEGVLTAQTGIVAKNLHSQSTLFSLSDVKELIKFLKVLIVDLSPFKIEQFREW